MAFTASVSSVNLQGDNFIIVVVFNDSATGFTSNKTYTFANDTSFTQSVLSTQVTADGTALKSSLTRLNALQARVGTVITI